MSDLPLKICFVTDEKPGHKNQLLGLEQSLRMQTRVESAWISVQETTVSWFDVIAKRCQANLDWVPDIVVGAGNSSHKMVLAIKRKYQCFSVILMKPSLVPMSWFDALIVPAHDHPPKRENILITLGVLNKIRPVDIHKPTECGFFLVGGESKHYYWNDAEVLQQIQQVINNESAVTQWILTDSRRTPASFRNLIRDLSNRNIVFYPNEQTPSGWVEQQLARVDQVWVTPDSVSMLYEAITSGNPTGVFSMVPKKKGRIVQGIEELLKEGQIVTLHRGKEMRLKHKPLCESDRASGWLLSRYAQSKNVS